MSEELPPNLQEMLARLQQLQRTLQAVISEKQRLELELLEDERALRELKSLAEDASVYKSIGALLIRSKRDALIKELEERRELLTARVSVLSRQEERARKQAQELQSSIQEGLAKARG